MGNFGATIARNLAQHDFEVMGIDISQKKVDNLKGDITKVVAGDASDKNVLKSLEVGHFDVGIVTMRDEVLANILCTIQLKELGVSEVIARASSDVHGKILEELGADKIVFPERGIGQMISQFFVSGSTDILEYVNFTAESSLMTSDHSLIEIPVPDFMVGKNLKELKLRTRYGVTVIAVRNDEIQYDPDANTKFNDGDTLLVFGKNENLNKLTE
ncbi:trk system potassium uptake protein TrkA [Halanaerobium saccharolyticum]|uniref:Trk system potassium uptake protein TrkA n=1 Tax=Halanaerobium saccharolyticum TaxID=43595 RepID=A0A4R6LTR1_9FIRM|nr:trk system potassium uptake protein TrkA [Halanaerobium saccharolyticum]